MPSCVFPACKRQKHVIFLLSKILKVYKSSINMNIVQSLTCSTFSEHSEKESLTWLLVLCVLNCFFFYDDEIFLWNSLSEYHSSKKIHFYTTHKVESMEIVFPKSLQRHRNELSVFFQQISVMFLTVLDTVHATLILLLVKGKAHAYFYVYIINKQETYWRKRQRTAANPNCSLWRNL